MIHIAGLQNPTIYDEAKTMSYRFQILYTTSQGYKGSSLKKSKLGEGKIS